MTIRVRVDRQRCVGAGNCIWIAPTAFKWRQGDFLKVELLDPETVELEILKHAAASCPTSAIAIDDPENPDPWASDPRRR